jgi:DNA-binding NarL/FixJ family response regulator
MAEKMFISEQTVKNHLHNIFDKLAFPFWYAVPLKNG